MRDSRGKIRPRNIDKGDTSANLRAGWARVLRSIGPGAFAEELGVDVKTVKRALTGETTPELHTAFSSLLIDPTALDEVAQEFGFVIRPKHAQMGDDFTAIAQIMRLAAHWTDAMADGVRDHTETLMLADEIRKIMPFFAAIVEIADRLRGVSA